ncbi:S-adenosyl-L-methionine-dependent methyltransferase [Aspergillus pseudoustus]|uniref:S-adenosyl-L-methionine-dependent methyltransferase n=1 Tax=Aspergillus pseudoustus TaxID=1810923 RepID=A0ABR4JDP8_9EURO
MRMLRDEQEMREQDAVLSQQLHGSSVTAQGLFAMRKDSKLYRVVLERYFQYFAKDIVENDRTCTEERRQAEHATMEPFLQAIARHEHYLAYQIGIQEGMMVLDAGCGLGGPAREIASSTNATIMGVNNSDYQIQKAMHYTKQAGLSHKVTFTKGNFTQMKIPNNFFDAAYSIEACVHAPTLEMVYSEIFRVLKPGCVFGVYEWLLTDNFDENNHEHRSIALGIQQGNGIPKLFTVSQGLLAMKNAGFELLKHEDLATRPAISPWYHPLAMSVKDVRSLSDLITYAPMSKLGRIVTHYMTRALEGAGIVPKGTQMVADSLDSTADSLVAGGKKGIFTPMYFMLARKPEV